MTFLENDIDRHFGDVPDSRESLIFFLPETKANRVVKFHLNQSCYDVFCFDFYTFYRVRVQKEEVASYHTVSETHVESAVID